MIVDALEEVTQVAFGVEIFEFRGAQQRVDCRSALPAVVEPSKQPVLAPQGDGAQSPLCCVVIDLESSILAIASERDPVREPIANRLILRYSKTLCKHSTCWFGSRGLVGGRRKDHRFSANDEVADSARQPPRRQQIACAAIRGLLGSAVADDRVRAPGACRGPIRRHGGDDGSEGWQAEATSEYGFVFIRKGADRQLLMLTPRDPRSTGAQSFNPFGS
jgi:hypothetical protein